MKKLRIFGNKNEENVSNQKISASVEWPDYVIELKDSNFEEFIEKYPLSIVDFQAPWCSPCKAMAPRLRRLSKIYKGKVAFGKINTQKYQDIAKKYKITSIPHLIVFRFGKSISNIYGLKSVGDIKNVIENFLKKQELKISIEMINFLFFKMG